MDSQAPSRRGRWIPSVFGRNGGAQHRNRAKLRRRILHQNPTITGPRFNVDNPSSLSEGRETANPVQEKPSRPTSPSPICEENTGICLYRLGNTDFVRARTGSLLH